MTSDMLLILSPAALSARTADSRPGPGPRTSTLTFFMPNSSAAVPARSAATCAANGVLLRDPRNPDPPDVAQQRALPCRSDMVMIVLLNYACMCATPSVTIRFTFFFSAIGPRPGYLRMGRRGPLRVRALVRVRWPFTGSPRRWRSPR